MSIKDDKRNVYLVGLMGAGKTTIAKALAKRLAYAFVDSDHEIEARTGVRLPTIFEIEGEEGFRRREAQVIADLARLQGHVVATGGGAVLRPENRQHLQASGFVVYLNVPLQTLCERTRHDRNRPLLQVVDPLGKLRELHAQRDPLYRSIADLVVSGGRITAQSVLQPLLKEMGKA
ncbi:MAG: shikimate kinase [Candidatus Accumulibacter sp.]|nr:shikimate kinase [Paracoccaceae bacterium]MCB1943155.1 shikimate kinase [Accumulibacter sp.]MCP5249396.1 shikimate kinase [Accumulibacter sp.]